MTTTPGTEAPAKTLDQINAPPELKALVAPNDPRGAMTLEAFLTRQGISADAPPLEEDQAEEAKQPAAAPPATTAAPKKLAGKFDSAEALERGYQELERKLGEKAPEQQAPPPVAEVEAYTPERGREVYGETVATAIEAAGVNPFEMAQKVAAGEDVAAFVDALVDKGGLPRPLVEAYLQGVKPQAAPAAAEPAGSINDNPELVAALRQSIGGDAAFQALSQWAAVPGNISPAELAEYQAAVDSGNVPAAQWALRAFQARASQRPQEPAFLGGGSQATESADVYPDRQSWVDERYAKGSDNQEIYLRDESYRRRVDAKYQRSKAARVW